MLSGVSAARPCFVVCEDGSEYLDRFRRFLDDAFRFAAAGDYASALAAAGAGQARGLLLDLDFRRTPPDRLVDEAGPAPPGLDPGSRQRLAETQGILILRQLRARGVTLPALLFADLDDTEQTKFLERTLAPLTIVSSRAGIVEVAGLMRAALGGGR
ncbi:MAG TPA: hypothetical protein VFH68_14045 [Polyangia bacterium]|nr:hypothetical protein [Polyangia bacterium]